MKIDITLKRKEILNDVLVNCSVIGRTLRKNPETEETAGDIMTPDDVYTKPVVARSLTYAFGEVKRICQHYLMYGRFTDDNRLDKMDESNKYSETVQASTLSPQCKYRFLTGIPYKIHVVADNDLQVKDNEGNTLARGRDVQFSYTPVRSGEYLTIYSASSTEARIEYVWGDFGQYELQLNMPNTFNFAMTETIKTNSHGMMVNYVMAQVLKDQYAEKAKEYANLYAADMEGLRKALISRTAYGRKYAADWS
ncbi:hypothetical protein [uncultured Bacteroides sp.]|uniref:hypothetical protein n=1 Tax=uncultured Bacteroides sp. TaxID=162156 RepID=UPI0025967852|nr:hypothetical protein [uncultured Bacteroides sp.]